jgi:hypothetical protein
VEAKLSRIGGRLLEVDDGRRKVGSWKLKGRKIQRLSFEGHKVEVETPRAVHGKVEVERLTRKTRLEKVEGRR